MAMDLAHPRVSRAEATGSSQWGRVYWNICEEKLHGLCARSVVEEKDTSERRNEVAFVLHLKKFYPKNKKIRKSDFFSDGATVRCDVQELEHRLTEEEQIEGL